MFSADGGYGRVDSVAYSPDGRLLATGGGDGTLRFWDTSTWKQSGRSIVASAGWFMSASFDLNGRVIPTAGTDSTVRCTTWLHGPRLDPGSPGHRAPPQPRRSPHGVPASWRYTSPVNATEWDTNPSDWAAYACRVAGRNLTPLEWHQFIPDRPYGSVCSGSSP